jgi:hypothetical protein
MGRTLLGDDRFSFGMAGGVCQPGRFGRLRTARRHPWAPGPRRMPVFIVVAETQRQNYKADHL